MITRNRGVDTFSAKIRRCIENTLLIRLRACGLVLCYFGDSPSVKEALFDHLSRFLLV